MAAYGCRGGLSRVCRMIEFDLLYPDEKTRQAQREGVRVSDSLIHDLLFDELCTDLRLRREEYEQLCEEVRNLPEDREVILFRQSVLRDLTEDPAFLEGCLEICGRLRDDVPRRNLNIWESSQEPLHKRLEEYLALLEGNLQVLQSAHLELRKAPRSQVLARIAHFLEAGEAQERLREIIGILREVLDAGAVEYDVDYGWGGAMNKVWIARLYPENTYMRKEKGFLKKKAIDEECLISTEGDLVLRNNLEEIYRKTLVRLCDFAARLNGAVVRPFHRIRNSLFFYQTGIRLLALYRELGVPYCLPEVGEKGEGRMEATNLLPLRLLAKCHSQGNPGGVAGIRGNDYSNVDGRIAVITGFNSGGKTTFLQALGCAQVLTQLGFPVPAVSYRASAVPYIGTLFAGTEDTRAVHGRLEQELVQIRTMAGQLRRGSLVLFNEILSSTSEAEGSVILSEVLGAFSRTHSHLVFVTHLSRLADWAEDGKLELAEGERALNYVTEQLMDAEGGVRKTFGIVRGRPEKEIYERELVERYLTRRES